MLEKPLPVAMLGKPLSVVGGIPMNFEGAAQHSWAMLGKALPMWPIFPEGAGQHSWAMPGKPLPMVGSIPRRCRPAMLGKPLPMVANIPRRCRPALMSHARETSTKTSINGRQYPQKVSIGTHEPCSGNLYQWWAVFLFPLNHVRTASFSKKRGEQKKKIEQKNLDESETRAVCDVRRQQQSFEHCSDVYYLNSC